MTETNETSAPNPTIWHLLPDRWKQTLVSKALSSYTVSDYLITANRWAEWLVRQDLDLEPDDVEDFHIEDFIAEIITATSAGNAAHHYRNLRVYFRWMLKRKVITPGRPNPMDSTEPPKVPERLTPIFTTDDTDGLVDTCEGKDFFALRDRALMLLFRDTGARVSELAKLEVDSIMLGTRLAKVLGKGNKERLVAYSPDAALALVRYLKARTKLLAGREMTTPRLWIGQWGRPLSITGIREVLRRRGRQANVTRVFPHRFRHTFAHNWKYNQGSTEGLMATGGWASSKMAEHYGKFARASRGLVEQQNLMFGTGAGA
jgi:site-specific recombinase XerD